MNKDIQIHEGVIKMIVRAIDVAITQDLPVVISENKFATNNYRRLLCGDLINERLEKIMRMEGVRIHHFKRHGWEGCLIVDDIHHLLYSVMSYGNFSQIPKKHRTWPHYIRTLANGLNGDYQAEIKQMDMSDFIEMPIVTDKEKMEVDFQNLVQGLLDNTAGWHHYVVTYKAAHCEISDIQMYFMDGDFDEIEHVSLMRFLNPGESSLLQLLRESVNKPVEKQDAKSLVGLKVGIKPLIREESEDA